MTRDEELDAILAMLCGELDDAELDRRVAGFRGALRRLTRRFSRRHSDRCGTGRCR